MFETLSLINQVLPSPKWGLCGHLPILKLMLLFWGNWCGYFSLEYRLVYESISNFYILLNKCEDVSSVEQEWAEERHQRHAGVVQGGRFLPANCVFLASWLPVIWPCVLSSAGTAGTERSDLWEQHRHNTTTSSFSERYNCRGRFPTKQQ